MTKGQVQAGAILATALLTGVASWLGTYVLSSPANASSAISVVQKDVAVLQKSDENQDKTINEVKGNVEYIRRVVEEMARRQGIVIRNSEAPATVPTLPRSNL